MRFSIRQIAGASEMASGTFRRWMLEFMDDLRFEKGWMAVRTGNEPNLEAPAPGAKFNFGGFRALEFEI
jgi:hypothetical protein